MRVVLVNPNTLIQPSDPLTTGIVYFPITLASLAGALRARGHDVRVVDALALAPRRVRPWKSWWIQGLLPEEAAERVNAVPHDAIFLYAGNLVSHEATLGHLRALTGPGRKAPMIVVENTQAVTAYALGKIADSFFAAGADFLLTGEPEERGAALLEALNDHGDPCAVNGVYAMKNGAVRGAPADKVIADLDALPYPAWDLFPLEGYWSLKYAHGPVESRALPLLTSRGCPYPCGFCVVPETNNQQWRARSAGGVAVEMEHWNKTLGVSEFHIEDLNPTIKEDRIRALSEALLAKKLNVTWKIVAGTKLDILKDLGTLDLMARAGCRYISMSPESGSERVLQLMKKPFRHEFGLQLARRMRERGIRSQACFVVGYPGEDDDDRSATRRYVKRLVKAGIDEIALFICTPVPGSGLFGGEQGYESLSELSFSPRWRKEYRRFSRFRRGTYRRFLMWKFLYHPWTLLRQPFLFLMRTFETKMEMAPYRALCVTWWRWKQ